MNQAIDSILEQRTRQLAERTQRVPSLLVSVSLHVLLVSTVVLAPLVAIQEPPALEFVAVQIVPVQALGVSTPTPAPAKTEPTPAPEPMSIEEEPEPVPEPRPVAKPEPRSRPEEADQAATSARDRRRRDAVEGEIGQRQGSPFGSSLGTSRFGAAVGGLDNPDFVYGYYVDQMLAMISAEWNRPPLGGNIEAVVHFRIHRDGHISEVRVTSSSGYNSFDLAGLRAVQLAAPFPKLPQSYRHSSLGVNLILR